MRFAPVGHAVEVNAHFLHQAFKTLHFFLVEAGKHVHNAVVNRLKQPVFDRE